MLEAARGWLTPAVLFVLVNLVIATIAVASRLMSPGTGTAAPGGVDEVGGGRRALLRAPSLAVDRLRASFSFSRLGGLAADHAPLFDYAAAEPSPQPPATGAAAAAGNGGHDDELEREEVVCIERSRSEAAAELAPSSQRPRARRTRRAAAAEEPALAHDVVVTPARAHRAAAVAAREAGAVAVAGRGEEPAVEVDARADDFIRRFREQLRLQRLDSILRYRDTLRRTGTA
ncbi:hypothetical protein SEVIR_1G035300v4 [Setaria viridis]|uniref:DUF4408 domain-containing protein n=1 Tax=Setaria viridis TaxID=4556 RepID=A0A4U6WH13_SETVI|nr:uncharacterized protein LOC117842805 [Setaria viridis]TKW37237.1 hypothetical protein SEVIR_1G035300v2 [Setaria viridis]